MLRRKRLEDRLDEAFGKRLTLVVAGAGFGKSTLLASWAGDLNAAWYSVKAGDDVTSLAHGLASALRAHVPELARELDATSGAVVSSSAGGAYAEILASRICEELAPLEHDLVLILDDAHELESGSAARLLASVCRHAPDTLHVVLGSRRDAPFAVERLRGQGALMELTAGDLAFTPEEVAALVPASVGDASLAAEIHAITGGWPAVVRMILEALRRVPASARSGAIERLHRPNEALFGYLAEEVLGNEPARVRDLIRFVAPFGRFSAELCNALGVEQADRTVDELFRRGLLVRPQDAYAPGWLELHALVREFAQSAWPLGRAEQQAVHQRAAQWFEEQGSLREALEAARRGEDPGLVAAMLERNGDRLLTIDAKALIGAAETLPVELRTTALDVIVAEAHHIVGDVETSLHLLERLTRDSTHLPPRVATWIGLGRWQTGLGDAIAAFRSGTVDGADTAAESLLLSWWARCHLTRGELAEARPLAVRSVAIARASGDRTALAHARHALAFTDDLEGDSDAAEAGYVRALEVGEASRDARARCGTHLNLGELLSGQGRYDEALAHLQPALRLAELHYPYGNIAPALRGSRAGVLTALGRFDEALEDARSAAASLRHLRSFGLAHPLLVEGDVHRIRGSLALATACYEQALEAAERIEHSQALVPASIGLARTVAYHEPARASELVSRALAASDSLNRLDVLLAAAWVALACGDDREARACAARAERESRISRRRPCLAEALELEAALAEQSGVRADRLREAVAVWTDLGCPVDVARCRFGIARFAGDEAAARRAERTLRSAGIRIEGAAQAAGLLACLPPSAPAALAVHTLGGFAVLRGGRTVDVSEWQSKKARDLLKLLIVRRGRPAPRDVLMEALWPGEEPARASGRLSVALSTLRSVLDPERVFAADRYVAADGAAISLRLENVTVDVEEFFSASQGDEPDSLADAESIYAGDFLEGDLYEDWAVPLREEARATYIAVARRLAHAELIAGRSEPACRYLRRVIDRDAYDESAHLELVSALDAAGQHGEARRAYGVYTARMDEIGVEAAVYPTFGGRL